MHQAADQEKFMQTPEKVVVDDRALIGWYMTPVADRAKVMEALERLVGRAPEDYPAGAVERWWPEKDLFAYHIPFSDGEFLVFFYGKDGRIHIDSLAPKERYEPYRAMQA
jgi:hypothetical protein